MSRLLVFLQVVFSASLVLASRPTFQHIVGMTLALFGIAFGLWAIVTIGPRRVSVMPEVRSDAELSTTGPYRLVRHPMYTALLLACLGLAFCPLAVWKITVTCALAGVLAAKAVIEEKQLRDKFARYDTYAGKTKRFIPFVW